jgi:hypothetical protein
MTNWVSGRWFPKWENEDSKEGLTMTVNYFHDIHVDPCRTFMLPFACPTHLIHHICMYLLLRLPSRHAGTLLLGPSSLAGGHLL